MKLNLCEFLGVEENEKFKLIFPEKSYTSRVYNNKLEYFNYIKNGWFLYNISMYSLLCSDFKIKKLSKKILDKNFTNVELTLLENLNKEYRWIARDKRNTLYVYKEDEPFTTGTVWNNYSGNYVRFPYDDIFKSISWEDKKPTYIDDYVDRN